MRAVVIIPAFNEEESIGKVVSGIRDYHLEEIIVVDNGSQDQTATIAQNKGAIVLYEPNKGYGSACLKGLNYVFKKPDELKPEIVVFMDGDFSDDPKDLNLLIEPIKNGEADFVIGSRTIGQREEGSLTIPQIFGNRLATFLIHLFFNHKFTDLGPFRAIKTEKLEQMGMKDKNYGWTIEMQIKAIKNNLNIKEVPVTYRNRIGKSKISGTIKGNILAGFKIIYSIIRYAL
jgi:glycosyltransferase involved in cell wall biosynthesis